MFRPVAAALAVFLFLPGLQAQDAYAFLRTDVSPRIAAMGGAFTSMQGDPNSLFMNPAALGSVEGRRLSVSYMDHLMDINAGSIALSLPETPVGPLTAGVQFVHYGTFDQTDQSANVYGTFTASDLAVSVGRSFRLDDRLSVGAAVKIISSSLGEYRSQAVAADLGASYVIPEEQLSIGLSLLHFGTQLSTYAGSSESLPTDLRLGITKRPEHLPVFLNLNFHGLNDPDLPILERFRQFSLGAEFDMSSALRLRLGFNNRVRQDLRMGSSAGLAGFSVGAGVLISSYQIDYGFNSYGSIGGLHRIGISACL